MRSAQHHTRAHLSRLPSAVRTRPPATALALALAIIGVCACDDAPAGPSCVSVDEQCAVTVPPRWSRIHEDVLPSCAGNSACHVDADASGAQNGLVFGGDAAATLERLLDPKEAGAEPWVVPGDAACSPLFVRLATEDPALRMPPGQEPLPVGQRCAVQRWIDAGAAAD